MSRAVQDRTFVLGMPLYFFVGTGHVLWGAMTPMLQRDPGLSAPALSWLITLQFLAFLVGVLGSPRIVARRGLRLTVLAALAGAATGVSVLALAGSFGQLILSGMLFGLGAGPLEGSMGAYALTVSGAHRKISVLESCFAFGALGLPLLVFVLDEQVPRAVLCLGFAAAVTLGLVSWAASWTRLDDGAAVSRSHSGGGNQAISRR